MGEWEKVLDQYTFPVSLMKPDLPQTGEEDVQTKTMTPSSLSIPRWKLHIGDSLHKNEILNLSLSTALVMEAV